MANKPHQEHSLISISLSKDFKRAIEAEAFRRNLTTSAFIKTQLAFCLPGNIKKSED